jgi:hypothetical protein
MMSRTDMNDTECERFMNEYLELDKDERVPFSLTFHLLSCKKCRTQVRLLTIAEKTAASPLQVQVPLNSSSITGIMQKINPAWDPETCSTNPVSMTKWIVGGIAMILFMLVFAVFTSSASDQRLLVAFYLVFGGVVTSYCALFVGSNMDFFVKKIHTIKIAM